MEFPYSLGPFPSEIARLDLAKMQQLVMELHRLQSGTAGRNQSNFSKLSSSKGFSDDQDNADMSTDCEPMYRSSSWRSSISHIRAQSQPASRRSIDSFRSNSSLNRQLTGYGPRGSYSRISLPSDQTGWYTDYEWQIPYVKYVYSRSTSVTEDRRFGIGGLVSHTQSSWTSAPLSPNKCMGHSYNQRTSLMDSIPNYHVPYALSIPSEYVCAQTQTVNTGRSEEFSVLDQRCESYPFKKIQLDDIKPPGDEEFNTENDDEQLGEKDKDYLTQKTTSPM